MSEIKDGGPAFPELKSLVHKTQAYAEAENVGGMTLRDYFAAKALVGLFAMEANPRVGETVEPFRSDKHVDAMARISYELADAMIRARGAA